MNEHMKVGHHYPQVRQALAYSFGLDDQDFVVAYETDDLVAFGDLVRDLRVDREPALDRAATRRSCSGSTARSARSSGCWVRR